MVNINNLAYRKIETLFNTSWTLTSIQFMNRELVTDALTQYIALFVFAADSTHETLNLAQKLGERHSCTLTIQMFVRKGTGHGDIETIADTLDTLLVRKKFLVGTEGNCRLEFGTSFTMSPTEVDEARKGWYQENYNIPFDIIT